MFGTSKFKKVKQKVFKSDNERKKYFAIQNYYKSKNRDNLFIITKEKNNKK